MLCYVNYTLIARNVSEAVAVKLREEMKKRNLISAIFDRQFYRPEEFEVEYSSSGPIIRRNFDRELLKISQLFPNVLFQLTSEGETPGEFWRTYYQNGELENVAGDIVYERPRKINWDAYCKF